MFYILGSMKRNTWSLFQSIHGLESVTGDGKREHRHFRNQWTKMEWNGWIWFRWPLYLLLWERSLRRSGATLIVKKKKKKESKMQYLSAIPKMTEWSQFIFRANYSTSQLSKSMPQPLKLKKLKLNSSMKTYKTSRTNTRKRCPIHHRGLECKSRRSKDTWSKRQVWLGSTKRSRIKANRVLPRKHTDHSNHPLPTTQETTLHMDITKWSIPKSNWRYSLQPKIE